MSNEEQLLGLFFFCVAVSSVTWVVFSQIMAWREDRRERLKSAQWWANQRADVSRLLQVHHLRIDQARVNRRFERERMAVILATQRKSLQRKWRTFDEQFGGRSERVWIIGQFLFCHKTRREIYDPFIEELREDLFSATAKCRTLTEFRWVQFFITLRTAGLICYCVWRAGGEGLRRLVEALFDLLLR